MTGRARRWGRTGAAAGRLAALLVALVATAGCVRGCASSRPPIHLNPNMDYQEKSEPQEASDFFYDGAAMRAPVPGTVAVGDPIEIGTFLTGRDTAGEFLVSLAADAGLGRELAGHHDDLLERGRDRFGIYCAPCHDERGNGEGILYERGKVPTTSLHDEKVLNMPDGQLFDVISNGSGLMSGYAYPIAPQDRWAIVAWVRELERREKERRSR